MKSLKAILSVALALTAAPLSAADTGESAPEYIDAMCTLAGHWTGRFEQYNETGLLRSSRFDAGFQCQPDDDVLMETNLFVQDDGTAFSTLKVIFPASQTAEMQMSYFYGGMEKVYFFKSTRLEFVDDRHWTAAREAVHTSHGLDQNPPVSRYTHIRDGNELTMIREVKPQHSSTKWTLSAKLIMQWQP
ncbi:hypothetical protein [uncultured Parasphingorhabdus sp.]|uniref:hypothetical protein n=1 Tax=uncultured Parasphingorhabdus sp. TaxID=2709694 RepID=UPI002AA63E67|nr:hypothetical protein [uncultured Parasphingorhabdus sp.]